MRRTLFTLLLAGASATAGAAEYQLMIYEHPAELAKRNDSGAAGAAYWAGFDRYGKALQAAGVLRGGGALQTVAATRVMALGGQPQAQTLPASGTQLGGWFVIDVADLDAAVAWAGKAPSTLSGGSVEVRPLAIIPGMAR
jgi:hypothetical protein